MQAKTTKTAANRWSITCQRSTPQRKRVRLEYWNKVMNELDAIPEAQLSAENQINYEVYKPQIQTLINDQHFREYEKPVNSDSSFWSDLQPEPRQTLPHRTGLQELHRVAGRLPRYFAEQTDNMRAGLKQRLHTAAGDAQRPRCFRSRRLADAQGDKSPFYAPFKEMPNWTIPAADQATLRAAAVKAIHDAVDPSYAKLLKFFREDYVPGAVTSLGATSFPDGKALTTARRSSNTRRARHGSRRDPHQLGLDEVAHIHAEMLETMKQTDFKGDFPAFLAYLRSDPKFYAKTPEESF